jgi:hypothetical protein
MGILKQKTAVIRLKHFANQMLFTLSLFATQAQLLYNQHLSKIPTIFIHESELEKFSTQPKCVF